METPMEPRETNRRRSRKEGAIPTRGMNTVASNGPPRRKKRVLVKIIGE